MKFFPLSAVLLSASIATATAVVVPPSSALLFKGMRETPGTSPQIELASRPPAIYPWKRQIVCTVFWIGEEPTLRNPTPNNKSSWDSSWALNYGGFDDPSRPRRQGYRPASFIPRLNPFYVALPYNDVASGTTKKEASRVIPWFKQSFSRPGVTVCKGRWVEIRHRGRVCYAQWEDCGPFRTDHWQYVFGNERPRENLNNGAGIDISPAVRDCLGVKSHDKVDWRFVEASAVPPGPWFRYGGTIASRQRPQQPELALVSSRYRRLMPD